MNTSPSTTTIPVPTVSDDTDTDDLDNHLFTCTCDECCENLWLQIMEDRAR